MKKQIKSLLCGLCAAALALGCTGCGGSAGPEVPAKVTDIMVWTYYNGDQLESFTSLVNQFNETVGAQKGIKVSTESQGSVNDLETSVMDSAEGKVGAAAMPNIFSAYADTAYALDQMGMVVDLAPCLTEEEKAQFVEGYLSEGGFGEDDSIKIFPVAKSTELLFLNDTDWQAFADAAGVRYEDLTTVEGVVETAERYYEWSGGRAMFGRDAMANYMLVGAQQLGDTIFAVKDGRMTVNFERDVARRLWDNYYVPFVRGWFAATGRFRSDDIKTGNVLAYVGSSSSATYFPSRVMLSDTESHSIALKVLPAPHFADGEKFAVQQGAGMAVAKTTDAEEAASVVFLKWLTQPENNIAFAVGSGYLPVTHAANEMDAIRSSGLILTGNMENILTQAVDTVNSSEMYTPRAFEGGTKARDTLTYSMSDLAEADRATVVARIAAGESAADAEAEFMTDEYFEAWYQSLCDALRQYEG